ncbi:MAG: YdcF family protein, partial [Anaerolineales bacterium]
VEISGGGNRLLYAAHLYHQGVAPHLLLTGGTIDWMNENEPPAQDMAKVLGMLGIPEEALWTESESRNTYENALFSRRVLAEKGIDRIILVTSAIHMPRAVALFEKQGFDVIPAPADYNITQAGWDQLWDRNLTTQLFNLLPSVANLSSTTSALKEYIGILVYSLRGWL